MKKILLVLGIVVVLAGLAGLGYWYWQQGVLDNNKVSKTSSNNGVFISGNQQNDVVDYSRPYLGCTGNPFEGTCQIDDACLDNDFEKRVYSLWKQDFISRQEISQQIFNDYVEISDVQLTVMENKVSVRIQAIYKNDWARSRNADAIVINTTESPEKITDEQIQKAIDFNHPSSGVTWESLYQRPIIGIDNVEALVNQGYEGFPVHPNFCSITSRNTGLKLPLWVTIDESKNKCVEGSLNLLTGESSYHDFLCTVD